MMRKVFLSLFLLSLATPAFADDVANGKKVYDAVGCVFCHGTAGQGGMSGPKIAPVPYPLSVFTALLRKPLKTMPPYSAETLPDSAVADIRAYLMQSAPADKPARDIPLLNP